MSKESLANVASDQMNAKRILKLVLCRIRHLHASTHALWASTRAVIRIVVAASGSAKYHLNDCIAKSNQRRAGFPAFHHYCRLCYIRLFRTKAI